MSNEIDKLAGLLDKEMLNELEEAKPKQEDEFEFSDLAKKYPDHSEVTLRRLLENWEKTGKIESRKSSRFKYYKYKE